MHLAGSQISVDTIVLDALNTLDRPRPKSPWLGQKGQFYVFYWLRFVLDWQVAIQVFFAENQLILQSDLLVGVVTLLIGSIARAASYQKEGIKR